MATGELRNWSYSEASNVYWGNLWFDAKSRWRNGTYIHTSAIVSSIEYQDAFVVKTLNSIYILPKSQKKVVTDAVR